MTDLKNWLDAAMPREVPDGVVAFCFNLYEDVDDTWSVELVGCGSFDPENEDWACDEVTDFGTRKNCCSWKEATDWQTVLEKALDTIGSYVNQSPKAQILKEKQAIAVGFVDGDLEIIYTK